LHAAFRRSKRNSKRGVPRTSRVICCLLSIARLIIRGSVSYHWASTSRSRSSSLHCKSTGTVIFRKLPHWGYSFLVPLYQQQPDKRVTIVLKTDWIDQKLIRSIEAMNLDQVLKWSGLGRNQILGYGDRVSTTPEEVDFHQVSLACERLALLL
jgi:hypothetical protein